MQNWAKLTETKKLVVPSSRSNVFGNNLSHVSSPNMSSFPALLDLNCASQVSWAARVDEVSPSSKFKMRSTKDGIEPVVMDLILGMVTVGDRALAVKGTAAPSRMRLEKT